MDITFPVSIWALPPAFLGLILPCPPWVSKVSHFAVWKALSISSAHTPQLPVPEGGPAGML